MVNKISVRIDGIEDEWEELENHIDCTRSEFIRRCIVKEVNKLDDLSELQREHKDVQHKMNLLKDELNDIEEKMVKIKEAQSANLKNEFVKEEIMDKIRNVYENEGGITKERITIICQSKVPYQEAIKWAKDEGIIIDSKNKNKTKYIEDEHGKRVKHRIIETPAEKSSFDTIVGLFKKAYKSQRQYTNMIGFLESKENHYKEMCKSKDVSYSQFKKEIKKLSK